MLVRMWMTSVRHNKHVGYLQALGSCSNSAQKKAAYLAASCWCCQQLLQHGQQDGERGVHHRLNGRTVLLQGTFDAGRH